jgi:hypothetical protein
MKEDKPEAEKGRKGEGKISMLTKVKKVRWDRNEKEKGNKDKTWL